MFCCCYYLFGCYYYCYQRRRTTCNVYEKMKNLIRRSRRRETRDETHYQNKLRMTIMSLFFSFPSSRHQVPFTYYNLLHHISRYKCITSHHITSHHITSQFSLTSYHIIAAITTTTFLLLPTVLQYISYLLTHVHTYYTYIPGGTCLHAHTVCDTSACTSCTLDPTAQSQAHMQAMQLAQYQKRELRAKR